MPAKIPGTKKLSNFAFTTRAMTGSNALLVKPKSKTSNLKVAEGSGMDVALDDWMKGKQLLKPDDQLDLTEAELKEEIARLLTTVNPQAAKSIVEYSYKTGAFVPAPTVGNTVVLVHLESVAILKDSQEAQDQIAAGDWDGGEEIVKKVKQKMRTDSGESIPDEDGEGEEAMEAEQEVGAEETGEVAEPIAPEVEVEEERVEGERLDEEGDDAGEGTAPPPSKGKKKLTNAFNFCERAALTYNNPFRDMTTQTIPPPRGSFSALVTQWIIFDAYAEDFERQQREKDKDKKPPPPGQQQGGTKKDDQKKKEAMMEEALQMKTFEAAKILDRMICLNIYDEISQDYRYYEDPSDEFRVEEGTLLPLWKFTYEKTKKHSVTDIAWNREYYDMFAVTFGSFDFAKQPLEGAVCLFTLKNPSYPEFIRMTDSAAMCVAAHPDYSYLLVIGLYDGNVAVYNTQLTEKEPQFKSNSVNNKHWGIVWQVQWGQNLQDGEINFYSISADGKVYNWVLMQRELAVTTVISLTLPLEPIAGPDGSIVSVRGCGTCMNFHPEESLIFLVGTEEGSIYKCSTSYSTMFLHKYKAHHMPVHRISYNRFYPDIFMSCSADWRVKIWEDMRDEPLFVFDLGCSVADVQWAPYSSTVFAAVTVDGKCHVYDININKYKPICVQNVISRKKNKLSRLRFNFKMPILVVGDDKGSITTLKLSPNLRVKPKPPKKQQFIDPRQLELMKLEKLLALVREPTNLTPAPDTESIKP